MNLNSLKILYIESYKLLSVELRNPFNGKQRLTGLENITNGIE